MSEEKPDFWCIEGDEILNTNDISEILQNFVDSLCENDEVPETVKLEGYDTKVITDKDKYIYSRRCLENILEDLDEGYNNYDGADSTPGSENMLTASLEFINKILDEYIVRNCDKVTEKEVLILDYLSPSDIER